MHYKERISDVVLQKISRETSEHLHSLPKMDGLGNCFIDAYTGLNN